MFVAAMRKTPELIRIFSLNGCSTEELIVQLDANGDGMISKSELHAMVARSSSSKGKRSDGEEYATPFGGLFSLCNFRGC